MADPSDTSFGNQGHYVEDRIRPQADSSMPVTRLFFPPYHGAGEQNTGTSSASMADQSTYFGNNAATEEENRTEPATHTSSLPPSSCSFYPLEATSTTTDVATTAVDTATAIASTAYSFNYHPPSIPSFSIPISPFQAASDLGARNAYSMLVCITDQLFAHIMTQITKDYLKEMISRIVSNRYRNIFFHIAQTPRGASRLIEVVARCLEVANIIFPAVSLLDGFLDLMNHEYGHFVVNTTLIAIRDQPRRERLYRLTEQHAVKLARNPIGHLSLMDVIGLATDRYKTRILNEIVANVCELSIDPVGALVIKRVLELRDERLTGVIVFQLHRYFAALSSQKLGSHIVEGILRSPQYWKEVADELLKSGDNELPLLANNPYGYYIVKRILSISSQKDRGRYERIVSILSSWIDILRDGEYSGGVIRLIR